MKKYLLGTLFIVFSCCAFASSLDKIIPIPNKVVEHNKTYSSPSKVNFFIDPELYNLRVSLKDALKPWKVRTHEVDYAPSANLRIIFDAAVDNKEGYKLDVEPENGITITCSSRAGGFYALQTLKQIIAFSDQYRTINTCEIEDAPRYKYRGLMLDPARHFIPMEQLKKFIDVMAMYKYNKLHLHLTDDQGWRIRINTYSRLTKIGAIRKETEGNGKREAGRYTQQDMKELVYYANLRNIDIIPELDMPGHSTAVLAAYPYFACNPKNFEVRTTPGISKELMCAGNPRVYDFYYSIFAEFADIFPHGVVHLGGDEAPLDCWDNCPKCQSMCQKHNLKNSHELLTYFNNRINTMLQDFYKQPMYWYEEGHQYPKGSVVYLWRLGTAQKVLKETHQANLKLICAPGEFAYFDYPQVKGGDPTAKSADWMPVLSLEQVYKFNPAYPEYNLPTDHVLGVEACVWGEYMPNVQQIYKMAFPRAMAMSEAGWSNPNNKSWNKFQNKVKEHTQYLAKKKIYIYQK